MGHAQHTRACVPLQLKIPGRTSQNMHSSEQKYMKAKKGGGINSPNLQHQRIVQLPKKCLRHRKDSAPLPALQPMKGKLSKLKTSFPPSEPIFHLNF